MSTFESKVAVVTGAGSGIGRALALELHRRGARLAISDIDDRVLGVNLWGVIHGTMAFLPHLIASGDGHVINIPSLNGYMAQGELSAYCTSKFAVRGFTESLRVEMLRDREPVKVTCVHPGGIKTNIARNGLENALDLELEVTDHDRQLVELYTSKLLRMDAGRCASIVLDAVAAGKPRVRVGSDATITSCRSARSGRS